MSKWNPHAALSLTIWQDWAQMAKVGWQHRYRHFSHNYMRFKISRSRSQNFWVVAISNLSSGEWAPLMVGPKEIISKCGKASRKIPHSNPAWMALTFAGCFEQVHICLFTHLQYGGIRDWVPTPDILLHGLPLPLLSGKEILFVKPHFFWQSLKRYVGLFLYVWFVFLDPYVQKPNL